MASLSNSTEIDNIHLDEQPGAPATPASGFRRLYARSLGIFQVDSAGVATQILTPDIATPIDATYIVDSADATLTNEITLATALATSPTIGATTPPIIFAADLDIAGATFTINDDSGTANFNVNRETANRMLLATASNIGSFESVVIGTISPNVAFFMIDGAQQLGSEKPVAIFNNKSTWTGNNVLELQDGGVALRSWDNSGYDKLLADATTDVAPVDDTTMKKLTVQRLSADPTNAAFVKFSNSPGTPTNDFYLVLEEG
jgi:hypothetical protein